MHKIIFLVTRKPGVSPEEFARTFEHHIEIVNETPGVRGMAGSIVQGGSDDRPGYDAIGELWWDDAEAFARGQETDQWKRVLEHAAGFMESHPHLATREIVLRVAPDYGNRNA